MKPLDDCHTYEMETFLRTGRSAYDSNHDKTILGFYRMAPDGTKIDGVTIEEVIRVLLHRINYLNNDWMGGKFHCIENSRAFMYLEEALYQLEKRTKDREKRKVEGTHEP